MKARSRDATRPCPRAHTALGMAQPQERGAVLIVALVFLLIMTLIGVFAMRGTIMEERMAGNLRDRNLAFEAGETALRDVERWLDDQGRELDFSDSGGAESHLFHYGEEAFPRHPSEAEPGDWAVRDMGMDAVSPSRPPEYMIKQRPFSAEREAGQDLAADAPPSGAGDQLFRIVVRAWGGSNADKPFVYLESQYRPH